MHPLLERQLRRLGLSAEACPPEWEALLEGVSKVYADADRDRYLLERSLSLASTEMRELMSRIQSNHQARFQQIFDNAHDVIFTIDSTGVFTSINRAAARVSGYQPAELIGLSIARVLAPESLPVALSMMAAKLRGDTHSTSFEVDIVSKDGARVPMELSTRLMATPGGATEILGVARDVRERRERDRLAFLASHDPLTGLSNRSVIETVLNEICAEPDRSSPVAVLFLDLDNFKLVNDSAGHLAGDSVLCRVADLLRGCLRQGDTLARMGGDEFAAVLKNTPAGDALDVAERMRAAVEGADLWVAGRQVFLGASIGIAELRPDDRLDDVLARADAAMYEAKQTGRNRTVRGTTGRSAREAISETQAQVARVRDALRGRRFEIHYQPIMELASRRISRHEALVRLRDVGGDLIQPEQFIAPAERFGIMAQVDRFVCGSVIERLAADATLEIFVNLSFGSVGDDGLLAFIDAQLRRQPGMGSRFGIELGERPLHTAETAVKRWVDTLAPLGVRFSVDGFEMGLGALQAVAGKRFGQVKLHAPDLSPAAVHPAMREVIAAMSDFARSAGVEVVAKSVEDLAMLDLVRSLGVSHVQGFYISPPGVEIVRVPMLRAA